MIHERRKLSFWETNYAVIGVVSIALFTDMLVYDALLPLLPEILIRSHSSPSNAGLLVASYAFGLLLATPILSCWSDTYRDRKTPIIIGQIGLILSTLCFVKARSLWVLVVARILQGIYRDGMVINMGLGFAASATWTVGLALVADVVPPNELGSSFGLIFGFNTLGYLMGPLLGGVLSKYSNNIDWPFYVCIFLALIDLIGRLLIKPVLYSAQTQHPMLNYWEISKHLMSSSNTAIVSAYIILSNILSSAIESALVRHLFEAFGLNPFQISLFLLSWVISSILFSVVGGNLTDVSDRYLMLKVSLLGTAVCTAFLGFESASYLGLFAACFIFGAVSSLLSAPTLPEMGNIVNMMGYTSYGTIYGITNICTAIGMIMGPLLGDLIYRFSTRPFPALTYVLAALCIHLAILHHSWKLN